MKFSLLSFVFGRGKDNGHVLTRGQDGHVLTNMATGRDLRPPYPPEGMAVTAQQIRDYREMRATAERMNRYMAAASADNFTADLVGSYGDANTEMYPYNYTVRARARTICTNTPHGKGLCRTYADNVVGDDPFELELKLIKRGDNGKPTMKNGVPDLDDEVATAICEAWGVFGWQRYFTRKSNMDRMETLRVAEIGRFRDGLTICRLWRSKNPFGITTEWLERDHLQEQWSGFSPEDGKFGPGNPIVGSIEFDKDAGEVLAYWLLTRHPGNAYAISIPWSDRRMFRVQVPAGEVIIFDNPRSRAEQDTGNTELDAVLLNLWRIHQYDNALTKSAIASASKPWWIEEERPTGLEVPGEYARIAQNMLLNQEAVGMPTLGPGPDPAATVAGETSAKQVLKPAAREELPAGKKLKFQDIKFPNEEASKFRHDNERDIATATHGSTQQVSSNYENLGFVAGLMSQLAFNRHIRVRQKTMAEDLRELFEAWLRSTILKGYFDKKHVFVSITRIQEIVEAAVFKGQRADFVNPFLQMQTLVLANEAGHMTDQMVQDEIPGGTTTQKLYAQRKAEQDEKIRLGLMSPSTVATLPVINKEGMAPPGQEKPAENVETGKVQAPEAPPVPGKPAGSTPQAPHPNRRLGELNATERMVMEMSMNGDGH